MKANDTLREYYCTENYYRYCGNLLLTDGAKALADRFKCYWLLDIIWSYQHKMRPVCDGFQVWKLQRHGDKSFIVKGEDGDGNKIVSQLIEYSDFAADEAELWVEANVILLPSEH